MYYQPTHELIEALRLMLSKNSARFTAEEVSNTEEAISRLQNLHALERDKDLKRVDEVKDEVGIELIRLSFYLMRLLLDPEVIKNIGDLLQ